MSNVHTLENTDIDVLVSQIADEFLERVRRGERPAVEDYTRRHPQIARVLEQVLRSVEVMGTLEVRPEPASGPAAGAAPTSGQLGDFRILGEIGRGGMGVVYEAEQISLGRRVALKVLPFAAVLDPRHLQRFKNEAQAAAALEHPNIVNVHAVGCERGVHYYAMQFIEGQTLAQVIQQLREAATASLAQVTLLRGSVCWQ